MKVFTGMCQKPTNEVTKLFNQIVCKVPFGETTIVECIDAPFIVGYTTTGIQDKISYIKFFDLFMRFKKAESEYGRTLSPDVKMMMKDKMDNAVEDFDKYMSKED